VTHDEDISDGLILQGIDHAMAHQPGGIVRSLTPFTIEGNKEVAQVRVWDLLDWHSALLMSCGVGMLQSGAGHAGEEPKARDSECPPQSQLPVQRFLQHQDLESARLSDPPRGCQEVFHNPQRKK
jgi:hypothetical protein